MSTENVGVQMSQHFLLSPAARSLSLANVARMSGEEAHDAFRLIRWADTKGEPVCPRCECNAGYKYETRKLWKCKACSHQFSVTSGTIFASRKLPIGTYLLAIAIFVNGAKGHSALQLSRDLDCQYKTTFVLAHKIREALADEKRDETVSGEVEIDGAYFGGYVKPANWTENRRDRRLLENQTGKRRVVVIMRERNGITLPFVFRSEAQSISTITSRVDGSATIFADEARHWDILHERFLTSASITRNAIRTAMRARTRPKAFSLAFAALKSARIIISAGATLPLTPQKWRGAKTTAAFPMANNTLWRQMRL
jgi:transposase-like protein